MERQIRYVAEWCKELGTCPETGENEPDLNKYGRKVLSTPEEAARYACEQNCYGTEGAVEIEELVVDEDFLEDTGRVRYVWRNLQSIWCIDGELLDPVEVI